MNEFNGYGIEDLRAGMDEASSPTITETHIVLFAGVPGDNSAVHAEEGFAVSTWFGGRIAQGFHRASVISAALANGFPGPGTAYLANSRVSERRCARGDTVQATAIELSLGEGSAHAALTAVCRV